jgi:hypothetical protein
MEQQLLQQSFSSLPQLHGIEMVNHSFDVMCLSSDPDFSAQAGLVSDKLTYDDITCAVEQQGTLQTVLEVLYSGMVLGRRISRV